jgi:peptidyl-prolyl cis-trans isomerase C
MNPLLSRLAACAFALSVGAMSLGASAAMAQTTPATPPATTPPATTPPAGDPVVAIVDGKTLKRSDVVASAQTLPPQYRNQIDQLFPQLVDRLIDITLMVEEGRKQNLQNDPDVKAIVAQYEDQAIRQVLLKHFLDGKITDADLKKRYDQEIAKVPPVEELRASHILVKTEDEAKDIIKQLQGGADFAKLAKSKSTDPGSGAQGGDLGYFADGDMVPEFYAAAAKLKKGEYTKEPVKSQYGWHVILLTDRRTKEPPKFEEVKDQIKDELTQELVGAWLSDLHKAAKIQKFGPDGKPLPAKP